MTENQRIYKYKNASTGEVSTHTVHFSELLAVQFRNKLNSNLGVQKYIEKDVPSVRVFFLYCHYFVQLSIKRSLKTA